MRSLNKKGQSEYPIITFAIILIGLIVLAPIILMVVRSTITPFSASMGNLSAGGTVGQTNTNYVLGVFVTFWDGVILFAFLIAIIMLFISAFLIDANPFFIIIYVLVLFLTIIFAPEILGAVDRIYEANAFAEEVALIPFIDFIRLNFGLIITVIGILTMIIIYAKIRYFPKQ